MIHHTYPSVKWGFLPFLLLFQSLVFAYVPKQVIPAFVGGIDHKAAHACMAQIKQSSCQLKNLLTEYKPCMQRVLTSTANCKQSLAFFKLTGGGIFHELRHYRNIDVILADYVYVADQGTGYFLVMKNGQYLPLPLNLSKKALQTASGYNPIAKKFPRVGAWQVLGFPSARIISGSRYQLIFTQQLKDGCNACALAGTARVAYDFSLDGTLFYGTQVLRLRPNSPVAGAL